MSHPLTVAVAVSAVVFVLSLARQAYALRVFSKPSVQCRRICYHIAAGSSGWAITGGAACLALTSNTSLTPMAAASGTVLVACCFDFATDSGRTFARAIGFIALRLAAPNAALADVLKLFESMQSRPPLDSSPKESRLEEASGTSGPPSKNISESPNNDDDKNNDSTS